jgi:heme/copper-type cytochrome/quinol oxidase subunit 4
MRLRKMRRVKEGCEDENILGSWIKLAVIVHSSALSRMVQMVYFLHVDTESASVSASILPLG